MDKELIEYLAKVGNDHDCTVMMLDRKVWTPERLAALLDHMVNVVQETTKPSVH